MAGQLFFEALCSFPYPVSDLKNDWLPLPIHSHTRISMCFSSDIKAHPTLSIQKQTDQYRSDCMYNSPCDLYTFATNNLGTHDADQSQHSSRECLHPPGHGPLSRSPCDQALSQGLRPILLASDETNNPSMLCLHGINFSRFGLQASLVYMYTCVHLHLCLHTVRVSHCPTLPLQCYPQTTHPPPPPLFQSLVRAKRLCQLPKVVLQLMHDKPSIHMTLH